MTTTAATAARFAYQARDQRGQVVNGTIAAPTLAEATKLLRAEGKYIVDIKPARSGAGSEADSHDGIAEMEEVGVRT